MKFGLLGQWLNLKNFWGLHDIKRREKNRRSNLAFLVSWGTGVIHVNDSHTVQSKDFLDAGHNKFAKNAKKKTL